MTGLASEGLNLLLPLGSQAPRGLFYRVASSVFEAFLPKRANQIGPTSTPVRQKGLTLTLAKQALRSCRGLDGRLLYAKDRTERAEGEILWPP